MKPQISLNITRRDLNAFIACLLSFSLLMMPFVPVAAAASRRSERQARVNRDKSSQTQSTASYTVGVNAPLPAPAPVPFAPNISATKSAALIGDDGDGKADPNPSPAAAEKIEYTVTISNAAGATDATGVTFTDTIDAHTTLVPGSVNTQPIADPDTYTASGNIAISKNAAGGVLANDRDPDTGNNSGLTVTEVQGSAANVGVATDTTATGRGGVKGKVTLSADGSFTYEPAPGFNGDDTFTYKISDGTLTDTATVTITVSQMVWFISNNAGGSNIGTFSNPFTSIASFNTANALSGATDPKNGDFIALRTGTGTYSEADGVNLKAQQKLIGNGIQFNTVFTADANSIASYTTFAGAAGSAPIINASAGNGVDLATDNVVRGLNVGNTSGFKINGAAVGSPIINTVNLTGSGGALNVATSGAFGSNVTFGTFESTSSVGANVNLVGVTGTLAVTTTGTGLSGSAAASAAINVSGGSVTFSYPGAVSKTSGTGALVSVSGGHTGTLTFSGTLSASAGTGLQFDNADGTYNFNGTTTLNGGDAGIDILNGSGGTFAFSASTAITSPTGTAFNVSTGTPNVTYSGTITDNTAAQRAVNIDGTTGGAISINSVTTASTAGGVGNTGININNTNGNVTFTTLTLGASGTRATAQQVTISGGTGTYNLGTVNVFTNNVTGIGSTNADGTINNTTGTVDANQGTSVDINGPVGLTTLGLTFTKLTSSGGSANGLSIQNTNGTFTVSGTGGTCTNANTSGCSGGTLATKTGADASTTQGNGVFLNNAAGVSLTRVWVHDCQNFGIVGDEVSGFTLDNSVVNGSNGTNTAPQTLTGFVNTIDGEASIAFSNITGSDTISNTHVSGGVNDNISLQNSSGVLNFLSITSCAIRDNQFTGNDGIFIDPRGTSNMTVKVTNSTLAANRGDHLDMQPTVTTSTSTLVFTGNTLTGGHPNALGQGITIGGIGTLNYNISNNSVTGSIGVAINATQLTGGTNTMSGTIANNTIGTTGVLNSGSAQGNCMVVELNGNGTHNATISGNTMRQCGNGAELLVQKRNSNTGGALNATITGNTMTEPGQFGLNGILVNSGTASGNAGTTCVDIGGAGVLANNLAGSGANGTTDFRVRQRFATTVQLPGYGGGSGPGDTASVVSFIQGRNNGVETGSATADFPTTGGGFVGGAACTAGVTPTGPISSLLELRKPADQNDSTAAIASVSTPSVTQTPAEASQPSLLLRALTAVVNFAGAVHTMVEPTAYASTETPRSDYVATAVDNGSRATEVRATYQPVDNSGRKATSRSQNRIVSNHARANRVVTPMFSGETVNVNIGTLRANDSVTIKFQVTVNNPPNLTQLSPAPHVSNTGKVSGTNFSDVFTNQVDTNVDLFDTTTTLNSSLNPSNFGDQVTFTATVAESPAQPTVNPTGTVDFIDTSNGNAVVCNDVPLSAGSAQCQTSSLTAGTHNIRADYSGDGNFDPSQSNVVAQVVIACTPNPIVTSTADSGAGSLRDAVSQVCSGTTITFDIAGAGPHTITLTSGEIPVAKNVTIKNSSGESITVSGNNASRVFNVNSGKTVAIIGLTLSGGSALDGAAVLNDGALTIVNSTLSGNAATGDGGAISTTATGTSLTLINTTLSGNTAAGSGGGLIVLGGTATIINSTITNNKADSDNNSLGDGGGIRVQAGTTILKNTIVAGNFNEDGVTDAADDISGTVDTTANSSFNLIGTGGAGGLTNGSNNNQVGVANPGLGALADNGGITFTHALLPTSPAVETGGNANLPTDTFDLDGDANTAEALPVDQRGLGFPRNADSSDVDTIQVVDIGAFELHPSIENIADQSTNEDTVKNVSFNIGDDTGSLIASVAATSSNTTLVPNANLSISGSGGSRNLQITPAANQTGTTTITVTVTATNGRTATDTFDLTVSAVNDPPSGTDNTVSTAEDTAYTFTAADFGFTDPNDTPPNTLLAVKITTLPGLGTLTNNNVPVNAGDFIPVADINGGLLKFTPAANGNGTPYTSFTFQVQDNGGGTDLDPTPNTMTINVTAVNDGPVNTVPGPQTTDEDVALVFSSGNGNQISVADIDAGSNPIKITLTATNGTLTLSTTAGLSFITGDGTADATMMFTGTLSAVNTALNGMSFTGTANFSGAASLQIVSDDQGNTGTGGPLTDTDSVNITINAVNDPPSGTDNTVSTAEDTAYTFTAADFGFSDPNDTPPNTLLAVKITTLPGLGTLTNNNVAVVAGAFIPVADINGGKLKFTPAADGNGTPYTTFTFQVQDNGGGTDLDPTPNTMTINVTAVNDAPVNTVPGPQSTTEDTPKVFSAANLNQISVADVDAGSNPIKITLTATNGTLTLSTTAGLVFTTGDGTADATMVFTGTLTNVNNALNGMSFTPTLDFNGAASVTITSDDQGNSGSGGPLTDTDTVNITVNAANDAPVVTTSAGNLSYTENDPATAIDTGLTVTDVDSANLAGATVAITSGFVSGQDTLGFTNQNGITGNYNSGTGVLTLSGSSSVANYQTALRSVTYQNSSDNPTASRTVTFIADDGSSTSAPATKGITINAVNDAPVNIVPGPQSTNQNTPLTFSSGNGNLIAVSDVDAGTNTVQVTLTATNGTLTLSGTSGLAFTVGDGTADATMTFTGTIANINTALNGMTFTPTNGFSGAASLTITTNDQGNSGSGGPLSDTDTVNIQVATNVSIQDASLAEPKNGTANMIFTVTLSAPAPAGGSSVDYHTEDIVPASINTATAGQDYIATSGTVSFAAGEQFKTILVSIKSDNKKGENNESFLVVLTNPVNLTIADGTATGTIIENDQQGAILISELRTSGPAGAGDDFVEIYNNSSSPHTVNGTGGGYGLFKMGATCGDTPVLLGVIPNGTVIPGRGHFLFTGSAYSLADYGGTGNAAGDVTMLQDIENDHNVAIFSTASLGSIGSANRLDAVGFDANVGGTCDLFREGTTLTPLSGSTLEYSYFRDECGKKGNPSTFGNCPNGNPNGTLIKDSNVNADDFIFADTNATSTPAGQRLGAPGPQNLGSPHMTFDVVALLLDASKSASGTPNRVRDTSAAAIGPNAAQGTLSIRRRFQNNTGAPVTRLRIRVVDISTTFVSGGVADLRLLTSGDITVNVNDSATCTAAGFATTPCNVVVRGTTLETPPNQPLGGGFNSSATTLTITTGTPLAPGASVNLQLLLGVQSAGSFKFFFNVEALP